MTKKKTEEESVQIDAENAFESYTKKQLRDAFAAAALPAALAVAYNSTVKGMDVSAKAANDAYKVADAMLSESEKFHG